MSRPREVWRSRRSPESPHHSRELQLTRLELCRFTDFLVFEVGLDGQVVRLKNIQGPQRQKKEQQTPEQPKEAEVKAEQSAPNPAPSEPQEVRQESVASQSTIS